MSGILDKTLTFSDAQRLNGPLTFNLMVKPAGSLCNLGCSYCYYLDKAEIYQGREPKMTDEDLERFVRTYIDNCQGKEIVFNWHGGEPMVMGINFYRKAISLQQKYSRKYAGKKVISNTLQTNGTLMTPEWAKFLKNNNFLVGVSIDGPERIHNAFRRNKAGEGSFRRVIQGIETMYREGVEYNLMCTVNHASEGHGEEIYSFLKQLGTRFIQFMPVVEHIKDGRIVAPGTPGSVKAPWSVSAKGYGEFLCSVFDKWVSGDIGKYFVITFEATLAQMSGNPPANCVFAQTCGGNAIVEHNGDVYCCDHFVYPQWKLGNLYTDDITGMMQSDLLVKFGLDKRNSLPVKCLTCKYMNLCNGECPKHRFDGMGENGTGLNALCEGLYMYFEHTYGPMQEILRELGALK